jgi:YD repeat-containing protein
VQVTAEDLSSMAYTYDRLNQLTAMNVNGSTTNFSYDAWGCNTGKTQGGACESWCRTAIFGASFRCCLSESDQ